MIRFCHAVRSKLPPKKSKGERCPISFAYKIDRDISLNETPVALVTSSSSTMPDLNDLLRWSIANSTPKIEAPNDQQLSLRFNPTPTSTSGSSTLHPSDPHYHDSTDDASDVSTSGPATPVTGTSSLAGIAKRSDLNSEILDLIMGKSDSLVMKEKMATAMDESLDVDQRVEALDDFEMVRFGAEVVVC